MWKTTVIIGIIMLLTTGCSASSGTPATAAQTSVATVGGVSPTAGSAEATPSTRVTTTSSPVLNTSSPPDDGPDPTMIRATCDALASERLSGRRAALTRWDEANRSIPFTDRTDPLEAECAATLENHQLAEALIRRTGELFSIGFVGERECSDARGGGTLFNRNDVAMDVLVLASAEVEGRGDGWGYTHVDGLLAEERRPVTVAWITPKPGRACGLWVRQWLSDTSSATASLHESGDAPDAELPIGAPRLNTSGEDWTEILESLLAFQFWAEAHPDPDLLEEYEDIRSGAWVDTFDRLSDWAATNQRRIWDGFELQSVEMIERIDDHTVILVYDTGPGTITRYRDDEVVETTEVLARSELGVFRRSTFDDRWRWLELSFTIVSDD